MTENKEVIDLLRQEIEPVLTERAVELVDIIYRREGSRMVVRLLVDTPDGITLAECTAINCAVSELLDEKDLIQRKYYLEVSSPGIDRPLTTPRDFGRVKGKDIEVFMLGRSVQGILRAVTDTTITVEVKGLPEEILLADITKARRIVKI